ncbi:retrotransposon protein, putative, ty1-copia subclass [Tanacetum coccineum]
MVRSMISQTIHPKSFWDYALESVTHILNMVPTKKIEKTPYEVWHMQAPKMSYLRVWGCETLVKRDTLAKPDKLEPKSIKCIFVRYPKETMGYSFYYPPENKWEFKDLEIIQDEDTRPSENTSLHHDEDAQEINEHQSDIIPVCRSTRTRHALDRMCLYVNVKEHELGDLNEPANYKAILLDPESDKWLVAMNMEMQSIKDNQVCDLVGLPPNAKGFFQTYRVDYEETVSPVADIRAIRILIAVTAFYDYEIWQMDIKTAFLNGNLSEEVYIVQPECFVNPKYQNQVCTLKRSIYGLEQASRQWNKQFDDEIKKFGFTQNRDELCVYTKASGSNVTFLIFYVDDILIDAGLSVEEWVNLFLETQDRMKKKLVSRAEVPVKVPPKRNRPLTEACEQEFEQRVIARIEEQLDHFVDQLVDRMNDMMNPRRRGDRNGQGSEGFQPERLARVLVYLD